MLLSGQKLAIFVPSLEGGGAQKLMVNLAQGFVEHGYDTDLVLTQAQGPFLPEVPKSVRIVDLKVPRVISSLPSLVSYLRQEQPQAMLCALNYANIVALWARRLAGVSTKVMVTEHNTLSLSVEHTSNWRQQLIPLLIKRFYPWADSIVTVSQGVAQDLVQVTQLPSDLIKTIYNPVVTPELHQQAQAPLEHPWFQDEQIPVILAAGRLRPQKDFATLIRAFAQVRRNHSARLLILGEGPQRLNLETLVRELGLEKDVSLPGFVVNPYAYMARACVFVLSSQWEGLGDVLIEALSCGTPVIATDCPHGPREILEDGKYGQLVPVGDVLALAQAMEKALTGHICRPPAESWQPFELETVVKQYLKLLVGT